MPIDAVVQLDRLRCVEGLGGIEPYAWTIVLWVDDGTIASGRFVGSRAPDSVRGSRAVIKDGMRAGEEAPMPALQRSFLRQFEDDDQIRNIGIVVALFEEDETPGDAVRAAYEAFVEELPRALADFIRTNLRAPTDEEREQIADVVRPKVRAAGRDALSAFEKAQVLLGTLDLDDEVGVDSFFTEIADQSPSSRPFTLRYEKTGTVLGQTFTNRLEIDGRLELRQPPPPDPCQAQVNRVKTAREAVDAVQATIRALQEELSQASPAEKAAIIREIRRIREEELPPVVAALEAAQRALALCRAQS